MSRAGISFDLSRDRPSFAAVDAGGCQRCDRTSPQGCCRHQPTQTPRYQLQAFCDGTALVRIVFVGHGEWDLATAPSLGAQLEVALAGAWRLVVVDLRDVCFLDLAGVDPIVRAVGRSR